LRNWKRVMMIYFTCKQKKYMDASKYITDWFNGYVFFLMRFLEKLKKIEFKKMHTVPSFCTLLPLRLTVTLVLFFTFILGMSLSEDIKDAIK